jgi:hypothetical protein
LREVLDALFTQEPQLPGYVLDELGVVRHHVARLRGCGTRGMAATRGRRSRPGCRRCSLCSLFNHSSRNSLQECAPLVR